MQTHELSFRAIQENKLQVVLYSAPHEALRSETSI